MRKRGSRVERAVRIGGGDDEGMTREEAAEGVWWCCWRVGEAGCGWRRRRWWWKQCSSARRRRGAQFSRSIGSMPGRICPFPAFLPRITGFDCALLRLWLCCAVGKIALFRRGARKRKGEKEALISARPCTSTTHHSSGHTRAPRERQVGAGLDGSLHLAWEAEGGIVSGSGIDAAESDWVHRSGCLACGHPHTD